MQRITPGQSTVAVTWTSANTVQDSASVITTVNQCSTNNADGINIFTAGHEAGDPQVEDW